MAVERQRAARRRSTNPRRPQPIVVLITTGSRKTAHAIAHALVAERLAACVNVLPRIRSIYRWKGRVANDAEWLLLAKSRRPRFAALAARVRELHPYEVPEIVALEIAEGSEPYLRWLLGETA
jgi:periplasmic divalent cation tolerance protein